MRRSEVIRASSHHAYVAPYGKPERASPAPSGPRDVLDATQPAPSAGVGAAPGTRPVLEPKQSAPPGRLGPRDARR
jgi:hypothetical protein